MKDITFVTGNQSKVDYLAEYLGFSVKHKKVDLDEIQSLDLREVVEHKVKQAYAIIQSPVIVEDVSLEFKALGRLPGTFIKWFLDELNEETICSLVDGKDRAATARCVFGYYDGQKLELIEGDLNGNVPNKPKGENGFGWDRIFVPIGYEVTKAELIGDEYKHVYTLIKPFAKLKAFLESL